MNLLANDKNLLSQPKLMFYRFLTRGFPPLKPRLTFCLLRNKFERKNIKCLFSTVSVFCWKMKSSGNLKQKVSKKFKTAPASLEKLTLSWLKPSKLAPSSLKQDDFLRQLHLFFDSPDEVSPYLKVEANLIF